MGRCARWCRPFLAWQARVPFQPTWDSLLEYEAPEWYQDAKFGIWAHWSPQCVPEAGDWYARNMYVEGQQQYKYQLEHYGSPTQFGYKELCAQWTLLNWEPDELITRYKNAGARLFVALANHHDSFDAWDSKHQPWNAAAIGPRGVVGGHGPLSDRALRQPVGLPPDGPSGPGGDRRGARRGGPVPGV